MYRTVSRWIGKSQALCLALLLGCSLSRRYLLSTHHWKKISPQRIDVRKSSPIINYLNVLGLRSYFLNSAAITTAVFVLAPCSSKSGYFLKLQLLPLVPEDVASSASWVTFLNPLMTPACVFPQKQVFVAILYDSNQGCSSVSVIQD